jgi:hypothetical protein
MADQLIDQQHLAFVLGAARLRRWLRANWIAPQKRTPSRVLFSVVAVRQALRRLERGERPPPDRIESARTNARYIHKPRKPQPAIEEFVLDFSAVNL